LARQDPALIDDPLLVEIAHKHDTTVQIILLAWALALGVGVVPKSASAQRIAANTMATMIHLDDDEVTKISHLDRNKNYTKCEGWTVL
jgi:alcohol dehydrogenase (NADP+)